MWKNIGIDSFLIRDGVVWLNVALLFGKPGEHTFRVPSGFRFTKKIKACRFGLIQWQKQNQRNSTYNKDHLESKLQQLFECSNFDQDEF